MLDLHVLGQVVQRGDDGPAVHLALVDLLGAVIEPRGVAEADGVGGGEQAEVGVRPDHPVLVEQGQPPLRLQHPLDHEHDVGPAGVVLVEHQGDGPLDGPGQHALAELGDLLAILQDDGVLADEVDPADVGVQVHPYQRPVQPGGHLLDVGRLAGAVIALHHHPPVVGEAGADGDRGLGVEAVVRVQLRHVRVAGAEGRDLHVAVHAEGVTHRHHLVGRGTQQLVFEGDV